MKPTITFLSANKKLLFSFLIMAPLLFQSCGTTKLPFSNSRVVPAAEGSVKVKKDKNKNYEITVSVMRLAEPQRLSPPMNVYVVWMETDGKGIKNLGQIGTSGSFLSSTLKSYLKTTSTFKPLKFFITAEEQANITYPGSTLVLETNSFSIDK